MYEQCLQKFCLISFLFVLAIGVFLTPDPTGMRGVVHADQHRTIPNPMNFEQGVVNVKNQFDGQNLPSVEAKGLVAAAIDWLLSIAAILALAALIIGGVMYIISLGNDQRVQTAKKIILYAIVGLLIVGASFTVISLIEQILANA